MIVDTISTIYISNFGCWYLTGTNYQGSSVLEIRVFMKFLKKHDRFLNFNVNPLKSEI